ncbi:hypothetical protein PSCICO_02760 [Pseudomonas cichorii]|nr:hypothetical protein [Pseudomonas cichorii]GFM84877.1 hypothetical protein PSCICO_02760 [Pseudomonas cichorii]
MLEANPNCPIRRRLGHLPWVGDNRAGLRHWLEIQRDPLAWLQKMHAMQPDVAVMRMGPQRVWCLFLGARAEREHASLGRLTAEAQLCLER